MKVSEQFIEMLVNFEGLHLQLYDDATSQPIKRAKDAKGFASIGVGHLVSKRSTKYDGATITQEMAFELLRKDVHDAEAVLNAILDANNIKLNQNQYDALVSFIYNVGPGIEGQKDGFIWLKRGGYSTIYKRLVRGDLIGVANQFPSWVSSRGVKMRGLIKRRYTERELFLKPIKEGNYGY